MKETKALVFRVPLSLKQSFRIALMENDLQIQQTMEAFLEGFIAYCKGEKDPKPYETIMRRARTLTDAGLEG